METQRELEQREWPGIRHDESVYCQDCMATGCRDTNHIRYRADNGIIPVLKVLHIKGYKTVMCCSGHVDNTGGMYSTFVTIGFNGRKPYTLPEPPPYFVIEDLILNNVHSGYKIHVKVPRGWLKLPYSEEEATNFVMRNRANLLHWAEQLPSLK